MFLVFSTLLCGLVLSYECVDCCCVIYLSVNVKKNLHFL